MINEIQRLTILRRNHKVMLQIISDAAAMTLCFFVAMVIRLESFQFVYRHNIWPPVGISVLATIYTLWVAGLYRALVRSVSGEILLITSKGVFVFGATLFIANEFLNSGIPRSVPVIGSILSVIVVGGYRFLIRNALRVPVSVRKDPVIIYGAGDAGRELLHSLQHGCDYTALAFVDDDSHLHGLTVGGLPVFPPQVLPELVEAANLKVVLLAMPNLSQSRRLEIFESIESLSLEVKTIPGVSDLIRGKAELSELRDVTAEDLLGRDPISPDETLLKANIAGRAVMVTGAGGSIGSELCRQILKQGPEKLVLFEVSEFALYTIEQELSEKALKAGSSTEIYPVLGSVQNESRLETVIVEFKVDTIYHAAAYKHVPIVEDNAIEGILNNVFGTLAVVKLADKHGVDNFILISTDKAVRPANVMGASKRIAELVCQAFAQKAARTTFSMVRFGNVLGSSGSVIPRFRAQIEAGGPVTVTHPEINRYFMTIPEAAELVIQAGALASGGEVFVLDMGDPVKIVNLAESMIRLHGFTPYFSDESDSVLADADSIPIQFTGLRKGEKLYEELLIGNRPQPTEHPRILSASEVFLDIEDLTCWLIKLRTACESLDLRVVYSILRELPIEYTVEGSQLSHLGGRSGCVESADKGPSLAASNVLELRVTPD